MNPKISLIQMSIQSMDHLALNRQHAIERIAVAASQGAHIVCLSELFQSPYFCQHNDEIYWQQAETIPGPTTKELGKTARKMKIYLVASVYESDGDSRFNTAVIFNPAGDIVLKYRKIHIPDDPHNHYSEKFYFERGNLGYPVLATPFGTLGVLVCFDQWFPEAARALAQKGAELIFYPTAIGWPRSERDQEIGRAEREAWVTVQRAHAIANGIFVAACNRVGVEQKINFWGSSFIADPLGRVLYQADSDSEDSTCVTLDRGVIDQVRKDWPLLSYYPSN